MDNSFYNISHKFLELNSICVYSKEFRKQLYSHEAYPSLKSLTDVLTGLGIEHRALKLNKAQLEEYGTPVLLHYKGKKPQFVVATHITKSEITYYKDSLKRESKTIDDFSRHWSGAALYVFEPEEQALACRISEVFIKWRSYLLFFMTMLLLLSILSIYMATGWFYGMLSLKLIGLIFSVLLLRHDLGIHSKIEQHICSLSKKVSCNAVLNSPASKLFGIVKMSDIGIVYFLGGFVALMVASLLKDTRIIESVLAIFSLCTFPYILFSLFYQKFKVKKWCPLCLGIIFTLSLEIVFVIYLFCNNGLTNPGLFYTIIWGAFFIWLALLWERLYGYMKSAKTSDKNEIRFLALKRNLSVFEMMLNRQPALDMMFSEYDIILGKPDTPFIITIAINPFCAPCLDLYEQLLNLLKKRPEIFKLNIRFMSIDEEKQNVPVGLVLMSAYFQNEERFIKAFDFWRKEKDFSMLNADYASSANLNFAVQALEHHLFWRKKLNINSTPTIFINNKRLPNVYMNTDLLYFLQNKD